MTSSPTRCAGRYGSPAVDRPSDAIPLILQKRKRLLDTQISDYRLGNLCRRRARLAADMPQELARRLNGGLTYGNSGGH